MPRPPLPLVALLGQAHDALEADFDARLQATEFIDLSLAHSRNVLRHLQSESCSRASQLVDRSGISKQALSLQIAHLEKTGYVVTAPDPQDKRARQVLLTARGQHAQRAVRRILTELDEEWRQRWGAPVWDDVRAHLTQIIDAGRSANS